MDDTDRDFAGYFAAQRDTARRMAYLLCSDPHWDRASCRLRCCRGGVEGSGGGYADRGEQPGTETFDAVDVLDERLVVVAEVYA